MSLLSLLVCERHSSCWFLVMFLVNSQFGRLGVSARVLAARLAGGCIFRSPRGTRPNAAQKYQRVAHQRVPHTRERRDVRYSPRGARRRAADGQSAAFKDTHTLPNLLTFTVCRSCSYKVCAQH